VLAPRRRPRRRARHDRDRPPHPGRLHARFRAAALVAPPAVRSARRLGRGTRGRAADALAGRGAGISPGVGRDRRRGEAGRPRGDGGGAEDRPGDGRPAVGGSPMKSLNLSEWAVKHPALVLFLILASGAAGIQAYLRMGRAEDPSFTIKTMVVAAEWPGGTSDEGQRQVLGPVEEK